MKKIVMDNHRVIIREVTDDIPISVGACQAILTFFVYETSGKELWSKIGKFLPKEPSYEHRLGAVIIIKKQVK